MLPRADSATYARVLARLGQGVAVHPVLRPPAELSNEAVLMARRLSDPATLAPVLYDRHMAIWGAANTQERLAIASEIVGLERSGDQALAIQGYALQAGNLLELGDMSAFQTTIENYDHLARDLRRLQYLWLTPFLQASEATVSARFEQAEQLAQEGLMLGQQAQHQGVLAAYLATIVTIRFAQGRLGELASVAEEAVERPPAVPAWRTTLAAALCQADRIDDARGQFERLAVDDFAGLPRDFTWMSALAAGCTRGPAPPLTTVSTRPSCSACCRPSPHTTCVSSPRRGVRRTGHPLPGSPRRHDVALGGCRPPFQGGHRVQQSPWCTGFPRKQSPPVRPRAAEVVAGPGTTGRQRTTSRKRVPARTALGFGSIWMTSVNRCRGPARRVACRQITAPEAVAG